jgi:Holliday junction resolvase RusA-like endonuclease
MIKILELKNIKLSSINRKYGGVNKHTGRNFLSKEYAATQELIYYALKNVKVESPVELTVFAASYKDLDNILHSIINMIEKKGIIRNDRDVNCLRVFKKPQKRGSLDSLTVFIGHSEMKYESEMECYEQFSMNKD